MAFRSLSTRVLVSGQISLEDIELARSLGVRTVISNRPDGEDPGQLTADEVAKASAAVGLDFVHAPARGLPGPEVIDMIMGPLSQQAPVLMFCRSGMRSAAAWALAMSQAGQLTRDEIVTAGANAGYDLSGLPLD